MVYHLNMPAETSPAVSPPSVYWTWTVPLLTLQRGVTSTARHSVNITCRGVTSPARHAARSHSFVYISTS